MAEYIDREKAISKIEAIKNKGVSLKDAVYLDGVMALLDTIPTADVVEVKHGRWIKKHRHRGGFRRYTGIDDMGETHTITVDERVEYDDWYCSECGKQSADNFLNYCANCGVKMEE